MQIGGRQFQETGHTYVMGILNVTPDSFSDGGNWNDMDRALKHVEQMIEEGVDIVDVGGESTRPGYTLLSDEEEIQRVVPVIEQIKANFDIPISLDTYKGNVARAGAQAGADLINDIWGLKYDDKIASVIKEYELPSCLMHNRKNPVYTNFLQDVAADLSETLYLAEKAGIKAESIILDPGVGFAKTYEQNLQVMRGLSELKVLGCPILLGCSRKSVIGNTLDLPVDKRLEGTLATTAWAVMQDCMFVRVHDVKENVRVIRMLEAIKGA